MAVEAFIAGYRVLYTAPTAEQVGAFWSEVTNALAPLVNIGYLKKNESENFIELPGTIQRIKAKTAWNADSLRGDWADLLIMDEYQLTNEDAWGVVGMPMLMDRNGVALFIYTPPSLRSTGISKARDPRHAAKLFKYAETHEGWQAFHFTSHENPYISQEGLQILIRDMSKQSYRQEILAEDDEVQLSWLVYKAFNETIRKVDRFDIPLHWPVSVGHDFGSANPAALFIAQAKMPLPSGAPPEMRHGDYVVFKEYLPGAGYSTARHVEEFKRIVKGFEIIERRTGGSHGESEIRQGYGAHGWPIMESQTRHVKAQIERVIGLMELNKLWIFNDLLNYLEELMNCLWKPDEFGQATDTILHEERYHLCADARYVMSEFPRDTVIEEESETAAPSFRL